MTRVDELREKTIDMIKEWTHGAPIPTEIIDLFDWIISAVREEGEERLQKYTEAYLAEGIKRCSAALAQGRTEGVTEERARQEAAYRKGEY